MTRLIIPLFVCFLGGCGSQPAPATTHTTLVTTASASTAVAEVTLHHEAAEVLLDVTITVPGRAARDALGVRPARWGGSDRGQLSSVTVNGMPTAADEDGTIRFEQRASRQVVHYRLQVHPEQRSSEWRLVPHRAGDAVVFFTRSVITALVLTGEREQLIEGLF